MFHAKLLFIGNLLVIGELSDKLCCVIVRQELQSLSRFHLHRCRSVLRQLNLMRTADGAWSDSDALLLLLAGLKTSRSSSEGRLPQHL
jgi:hypothetical protein